jgi:hypothetical protein
MSSKWLPRTLCIGLVLALPLAGGTGCTTTPPDEQKAPEIPPDSTMVIDFADFTTNGAKVAGAPTAKTLQEFPGGNWLGSAGTVAAWNFIIGVTLVVPVTAFVESFNHEPTLLEDGTWEWAYEYRVAGVLHTARLQAQAENNAILWNMFITKDGEYTDFNWFSGESNLLGTEGTWTLNLQPNDPIPFVFIEWSRSLTDDPAQIKYTNITPDVPENGGFITYGITDETPFDAFYTIFQAELDNTTDIEWNRASQAGRVRDPRRFDDSDWHCWDEELQNIACAEAE